MECLKILVALVKSVILKRALYISVAIAVFACHPYKNILQTINGQVEYTISSDGCVIRLDAQRLERTRLVTMRFHATKGVAFFLDSLKLSGAIGAEPLLTDRVWWGYTDRLGTEINERSLILQTDTRIYVSATLLNYPADSSVRILPGGFAKCGAINLINEPLVIGVSKF